LRQNHFLLNLPLFHIDASVELTIINPPLPWRSSLFLQFNDVGRFFLFSIFYTCSLLPPHYLTASICLSPEKFQLPPPPPSRPSCAPFGFPPPPFPDSHYWILSFSGLLRRSSPFSSLHFPFHVLPGFDVFFRVLSRFFSMGCSITAFSEMNPPKTLSASAFPPPFFRDHPPFLSGILRVSPV